MRFPRVDLLVIEDDEFARQAIVKLLSKLDNFSFELKEAGTMADGLMILEQYTFQAIVLDLNLPDSQGLETLDSIRAAAPKIPIVILTGVADSKIAMKALEMGADEYLEKSDLSGPLLARTIHFAIERRKAAEKIRAEKAQKELILDSLFEHVLLVDKEMNILWANRSARKGVSFEQDDYIGRPCREFWSREKEACEDCILQQVVTDGVHRTSERKSANGRSFYITGTPVLDDCGNLVGAVEISLETTQLKTAERALEQSERRYGQLVHNAVDIICNVDKDGKITFVNQAIKNILGYEPEEIIGHDIVSFESNANYRKALNHYVESFAAGAKRAYSEFPVTAKNGEEVWLGQNMWRAEDGDETSGYQAIARDITDLKKTRDSLEAAHEYMEERIRRRTAQLEEAKLQWERTFDAVPDRLAIIDMDYRLLRVNTAMAKAMGGQPEEFVGKICREAAGCSSSAIQQCPHTLMMADKKPHTMEIIDHKNNVALSVSAAPLYDKNGEVIGSVHVSRDISEMKNTAKALQEQLNFQQKLMDTIPNPVFFKDKEAKYTGCNSAFENFLGIARHGIIGKTVFDISPRELAEIYHQQDLKLFANRRTQHYEAQVPDAAGDMREVIFNKAILFGADGEPAGLVGIIVDISERRKAERALRGSEERYRTLVETLSEGLIIVDQDLDIVFANKRFKEMVGVEAEDIADLNLLDFMDEDNQKIVIEQYEKRRLGGDDTYEVAFTARDGTFVYTLVSPKPIFDPENIFKGSYALVTDITERKKLESQLVQAQKLESIGQLAAGIAHEINTPTQYVLSNTRFLEGAFSELSQMMDAYEKLVDKASESADLAYLAQEIKQLAEDVDFDFLADEIPKAIAADVQGLERIAKIVGSMKAFAHPGEDDFSFANLNKAIESTVTVARNEWKYVADVELALDRAMPLVPCLAAELNQVFLNILVNAAQAIGEVVREGKDSKGLITITTSFNEEYAEVRIADNGPGVPDEIKGRLFDPFFTTKEPGKGTGQGLAIAYRVVTERHKGNIWISSEPGKGTEFCIQLPFKS